MESNFNTEVTKIEFDVNLTCNGCANSIKKALSLKSGIKSIDINVERQSVIVETSLPSQAVKEAIESTGKRAVLKGFGLSNLGSAVAELKSVDGVLGVIRFNQKQEDLCVIDGTVDGLSPGEHGLYIHEFGDLSEGCNSIGPHFNPDNYQCVEPSDERQHYGDVGNIIANSSGQASFVLEDKVVKVWDIIGRSIAVTSKRDDVGSADDTSKLCGHSGNILSCAIIARSSGIFQNPKRICQCDGVSIWDETNVPASSL